MAQENNRKSKLSGMTTKQKATTGALIFIVLIVIWQVMGLFGGDSATTPTATTTPEKPATQMTANAPPSSGGTPQPRVASGQPGMPPSMMNPAAPSAPAPQMLQTNDQAQLRQAAVIMENKMLEAQKNAEEKYIDQLNQLQTLKVQKDIAETNQAIASARLATVTAEKNVSDLLTKPTQPVAAPLPPPPSIPSGAYSNALVNPTLEGSPIANPEGGAPSQPPAVPPVAVETPYVVISVSMQLGRWNAVIGQQGKLYSVMVGDVLPADESIVTSINKNGVILKTKKGKQRRISILTSI